MTRSVLRRLTAAAAALVVSTALLAGCGASAATPASSAGGGEGYPMTLTSPYGETTLQSKPERVAVVSSVDLDIALALGIVPVISPQYGDAELDPWEIDALKGLGEKKLTTYDSTDGVDYEAIAVAEPGVILATSGWTLDADYEQLSKIAPIVSYTGADGLSTMTWEQRTESAATALGRSDQAKEVIDSIAADFDAAAAAHPEFAGTTFTYAVIHPEQITYISYEGSDVTFFTKLGLALPERATDFSATSAAVSRENLDLLDADILLMGYPFGDEGLLTQSDLEQDALFRQIPAVEGGHYAVIDDAFASPLAYPTPLTESWLLERLVPVLADAVAGNGGK
ncbi:ABC transporter substrate-binding protein [Microbacterium sp. WHRI 7836]|uniref:ABC transporter substrate-binding protein n=1 Tax=Microbacterium sp. WHRI 7836 TaxID=3162563 RepID=UPI0032F01DA2